jgi:hypothetical protein
LPPPGRLRVGRPGWPARLHPAGGSLRKKPAKRGIGHELGGGSLAGGVGWRNEVLKSVWILVRVTPYR